MDIGVDPREDITLPGVSTLLLSWIRQRRVRALWLGTPCGSWSLARRGHPGAPGGPLRSREFIYGLEESLSRPIDAAKIRAGNITMWFSCQLIRAAKRMHVPIGIENPASSRIWHAPPMAHLLKSANVQAITDFCQHGTAYRKRTQVYVWGGVDQDALHLKCSGRGKCSRTGRPHLILQGVDPVSRRLRTELANPYPKSFARACALALMSAIDGAEIACLVRCGCG